MERIALFAGSFDPITVGHVEIVVRGLALFDRIVVGVGINSQKKYLFSVEERVAMLKATFIEYPQVEIATYEDLTVEFARRRGIRFLLRGLRSAVDLEYEQPIAYVNQHLYAEVEVVCLLSKPQTAHISSSIVREIVKYNKEAVEGLVPNVVMKFLREKA